MALPCLAVLQTSSCFQGIKIISPVGSKNRSYNFSRIGRSTEGLRGGPGV